MVPQGARDPPDLPTSGRATASGPDGKRSIAQHRSLYARMGYALQPGF
jgi:hypothetical protein